MLFHGLDRYRDEGLLVLRLGIGLMFLGHGVPMLMAGPEVWAKLGGALGLIGFQVAPTLMGLLAALAEAVGGLLLMLGFLTRPACFFLLGTMIVASLMHILKGDGFTKASHAVEAGILFFSLILIGPGRHSVDARLVAKESGDGSVAGRM